MSNTNPDNIQVGEECYGYFNSKEYQKGTLLLILPDDYVFRYIVGVESLNHTSKKATVEFNSIRRSIKKYTPTKEQIANLMGKNIEEIDFSNISSDKVLLLRKGDLHIKDDVTEEDDIDKKSNTILAVTGNVIKFSRHEKSINSINETYGKVQECIAYVQDNYLLEKALKGYTIKEV